MRLLTWLVVLALLCASGATSAGAPQDACAKDVIIYFDVSASMYVEEDGVSTARLFADALAGLLSREDFTSKDDRVQVIAFAERVALLAETTDAASRELLALGRRAAEVPEVGNRDLTNLSAVLTDLQRRSDAARQQIFIIASDFADDPEGAPSGRCAPARQRIVNFRAAATKTDRELSPSESRKLALLTSPVQSQRCRASDEEVSAAVIKDFDDILKAQPVEIGHQHNQIANLLRQAVANLVLLERAPPNRFAAIAVTVRNPNPFPVVVTNMKMQAGRKVETLARNETIGCGEEKTIEETIPDSLTGEAKLRIDVTAETKPAKPLAIETQSIVISRPEVHVFDYFGTGTFAVELFVQPSGSEHVALTVTGIPGTTELKYTFRAKERLRVALTAEGDPTGDTSRIAVKVTDPVVAGLGQDERATLYLKDGSAATAEETKAVHVRMPADPRADDVPVLVRRWAIAVLIAMILSALGMGAGSVLSWYRKFNDVLEFHEFLEALGLAPTLVGGTSGLTAILLPYGSLTRSATVETLVLSLAATGTVFYALRWFSVLWLWRRLFEPALIDSKRAIRRRRLLTLLIAAAAVGAGWWVYSNLHGALVNSVLISAEPAA